MTSIQIVRFLHQVATVVWLGGAAYATFVLVPALSALEPPDRGKLMGATVKRFVPMAWAAIIVLVGTGLVLMNAANETTPNLMESEIGSLLVGKIVVVGIMIMIAMLITFVVGPKAAKAGPSPEGAKYSAMAGKLGLVNIVLGAVVLLLVALMKGTSTGG